MFVRIWMIGFPFWLCVLTYVVWNSFVDLNLYAVVVYVIEFVSFNMSCWSCVRKTGFSEGHISIVWIFLRISSNKNSWGQGERGQGHHSITVFGLRRQGRRPREADGGKRRTRRSRRRRSGEAKEKMEDEGGRRRKRNRITINRIRALTLGWENKSAT